MSPRTLFLSRLIGLYCIVIALSMMTRRQGTVETVTARLQKHFISKASQKPRRHGARNGIVIHNQNLHACPVTLRQHLLLASRKSSARSSHLCLGGTHTGNVPYLTCIFLNRSIAGELAHASDVQNGL